VPFYLSSILDVFVIFGKVLSIKSNLTSNVIVVKVVLLFTSMSKKFPRIQCFCRKVFS